MPLSKKFRLRLKKEIDHVFEQGKSVRSRFFLLKFGKNDVGHVRFATVIPKKLKLNSVERNYQKRRITKEFEALVGKNLRLDIIAIPNKPIEKGLDLTLTEDIKNLMGRLIK